MAAETFADDGMDLEYDDPELQRMREEAAKMQAMPDVAVEQEQTQMQESENLETNGVEEGELVSTEPVPNKLYIESAQMVSLTSKDLENFVEDTYQADFQRIEWINDTRAKIVYANASAASAALDAFSANAARSPLEPRRAIAIANHPRVEMFVRQAVVTDMKQRGAASKSKFYDDNPAYRPDPDFRRREYDRPRRGGGRPPRRVPEKKFDENLYDDDADSVAARRASQDTSASERDLFADRPRGRAPRGRDEDLFAGKKADRLRSASPVRDGDGRFGFSDDVPQRKTARHRTPPPMRRRSGEDNRGFGSSMKAELFPRKKKSTAFTTTQPVELFPSHAAKSNELFPDRVANRHDAYDMHSDEATQALGGWDLHKQSASGSYQPSSRRAQNGRGQNGGQRDLFSRIHGDPDYGRLKSPDSLEGEENFSFKGASSQGFSFRGASKDLFAGRARR